ncbi:MAG: hypothetical protein JWO23_1169 [Solirubrobacterales bacterium]|nr:hypothetical protein [Solirubrobacterales bacterium]
MAVGELGIEPPDRRPAGWELAGEQAALAHEALTLSTACACGHTRKDHCGLRIEVNGRCLQCDCGEFARAPVVSESPEQVMEQIRARLDEVDRLRESVAGLCAELSHETGNGHGMRKH